MKKTVSEIAQELDISRQAVHQLMDKLPNFREEHVTKDGRKFLVDEKGVTLLHESRQVGAAPMSSTSSDDVKHVKQKPLDEVDELDKKEDPALDDLDKESDEKDTPTDGEKDQADLLAFYQEQLQAKDEQLAARAKEVDDLHRLLENSQKLQLLAEQRNKELKERIAELGGYIEHKDEKTEKNSSSSTSSTSSQPSPTPKKKGFFARLFGGD